MNNKNQEEELTTKPLTRSEELLLEIKDLDSLDFDCDLSRFPVTLSSTVEGKKVKTRYYLRELMAFEYDKHENFQMQKHRDAEKSGDDYIDTEDLDAHLISLCMFFTDTDEAIGLEEARNLPERVQKMVVVKCKELNGMVSLSHVKKE